MNTFTFKGKEYELDDNGFLSETDAWDEDFADGMAPNVEIYDGLCEEHWKIIDFIRDTYERYYACPIVYDTCKKTGTSIERLKDLFPTGYQRGACLLAGVSYKKGYTSYYFLNNVMQTIKGVFEDKDYTTDSKGFLKDYKAWDESWALNKADELKMPGLLTDKHWEIIYFLRHRFEKDGSIPTIFEICEENDIPLDELEELFPDGYHRGAVKIAGLKLL